VIVRLVVRVEPMAQPRPRAFRMGKGVQVYEPTAARQWKAVFRDMLGLELERIGSEKGRPAFPAEPVSLEIEAAFTCPKSDHRKTLPRPRRWHVKPRNNADNVAKAVMDACNGLLYLDDGQVAELKVRKLIAAQGETPYVMIEATALAEDGLGG